MKVSCGHFFSFLSLPFCFNVQYTCYIYSLDAYIWYMKRKIKQQWPSILPISTQRTIYSYFMCSQAIDQNIFPEVLRSAQCYIALYPAPWESLGFIAVTICLFCFRHLPTMPLTYREGNILHTRYPTWQTVWFSVL